MNAALGFDTLLVMRLDITKLTGQAYDSCTGCSSLVRGFATRLR